LLRDLEIVKGLVLSGQAEKIFILLQGENVKVCTSNGLTVKEAKNMIMDFTQNYMEYIDNMD
jgi:hypothetical protein